MPTRSPPPVLLRKSQIPFIAEVRLTDMGSGIYFLLDENDDLLYVGQSVQVAHRCTTHAAAGMKFARATWQPAEKRFLTALEKHYIFEFLPRLNIAGQSVFADAARKLKAARKSRPYKWLPTKWGHNGRHADTFKR